MSPQGAAEQSQASKECPGIAVRRACKAPSGATTRRHLGNPIVIGEELSSEDGMAEEITPDTGVEVTTLLSSPGYSVVEVGSLRPLKLISRISNAVDCDCNCD